MGYKSLPLDKDLKEYLQYELYEEDSFPFEIWTDEFENFLDHTLPLHWHGSFEIAVVTEGSLQYYINGTSFELHKNDFIFVNSSRMHLAKSQTPGGKSTTFGFVFAPSLFSSSVKNAFYFKYILPTLQVDIDGFIIYADSEEGRQLHTAMMKLYHLDKEDYGYELQTLALIAQIWTVIIGKLRSSSLTQMNQAPHDWHESEIKEVLSYIHKHYHEKLSMDNLYKMVNISRSEYFRSFKHCTTLNPTDYINEFRLRKAAQLLTESPMNITEICTACGFNSSSYFGVQFKRRYGVTPKQYRKKRPVLSP